MISNGIKQLDVTRLGGGDGGGVGMGGKEKNKRPVHIKSSNLLS